MRSARDDTRLSPWQRSVHTVIFEADTPGGKAFDVALLLAIVASIVVVSLESVASIHARHGTLLKRAEWTLTILFTLEYLLRLASVGRPMRYAVSFFGVVDLLAILPAYVSLAYPGAEGLAVVRALRLLRVFRVLKLGHFLGEADLLRGALRASARKIIVFLGGVLTVVIIVGALMHLIEGEDSGFSSIPEGMYWAVVTLTTVGYGDIAPDTVAGKALASLLMILGYGIIAVPTGIVSAEMAVAGRRRRAVISTQACQQCSADGHAADAEFCRRCGALLEPGAP